MRASGVLLPLLLVAASAAFYSVWQTPSGEKRDTGHNPAVSSEAVSSDTRVVRNGQLDFSGVQRRKFHRPRRDLFGPLFPPPPTPIKPKVVARPIQPVPVPVTAPAPPVPVLDTRLRMPTFRVLGFLAKKNLLTAFVLLKGDIYLVKKDQQFAGEYQVSDLNQKKITITRIHGTGEITLPLVEASRKRQKTLLPGKPLSRPVIRRMLPPGHPTFKIKKQ